MTDKLKSKTFWGLVLSHVGAVLAGTTEVGAGLISIITAFFG